MNTEEKAKAYDEALERAKKWFNPEEPDLYTCIVESIFPELAESDDERIREALIEMVHDTTGDELWIDYDVHKEEALAWLEKQGYTKKDVDDAYLKGVSNTKHELGKQGEQKPFDYENANIQQKDFAPKIEPKFKVRDWVTNSIETVQITGYDIDYGYQVDYKGNLQHRDTDIIEKEYHLWTIQDAKDGDVLVNDLGNICIYQEPSTTLMYHSYCYGNQTFFFDMGGSHKIVGSYPATKEQRDLLFQKMKEAGYEWNEKEKRLIKVPKTKEETDVLKQLIDEEKSAFEPDVLIEESYQQQADDLIDMVT